MKKILTFAFFWFSSAAFSQWELVTQLPSTPTVQYFGYVKFYDENTGYAQAGSFSIIENILLKTSDGGVSWTPTYLPIDFPSKSLHFLGSADRFILGAAWGNFTMHYHSYRSLDGGATFDQVPALSAVGDFYFKNATEGFCWQNQALLSINYSANAGATWTFQHLLHPYVYSMYFPEANGNLGYAFTGNSVLTTNNNGVTWSESSSIPAGDKRVYCTSPTVWYKALSTGIFKTVDSGASWTQTSNFTADFFEFSDAQTGFARHNFLNSIFRTIDGGVTWHPFGQFPPFEEGEEFSGMSFPNSQVGYVLTSKGKLYKCENIMSNTQFTISQLGVYPNPAKDQLFIQGTQMESKNYAIYDLTGRKIQTGRIETNAVDIAGLMSGYYFLKINDHQTAKFKKE